MEKLQLGSTQRDGLLAVSVHAGVGRLGNLSEFPRAVHVFRGCDFRSKRRQSRWGHRPLVADTSAFRAVAQWASQSDMGGRRAGACVDVHYGPGDVVESRPSPALAPQKLIVWFDRRPINVCAV